jgi:SAM-dependent methyltransferase
VTFLHAMQHEQFQLHADIEDRHWWFVGRRRILGRLVGELLSPSPETLIVDVGCGTGGNIAALADRYRCIGIDTSADAVELAKGRFPQVAFIAGRAPGDMGALAKQARIVLLSDVLEHVEEDRAMFAELVAAASPGCYFLLTVPADPSLWSQHDESFGHHRRYDVARFAEVWADLPVVPLLVSYFNSRLLPVVRLVRTWNRRRGHAAGRVGTDFWLPNPIVNAILTGILAGEARRLVPALQKGMAAETGVPAGKLSPGAYSAGASLIAVLRRGM